ncbi:MAG TPA: hypothetical protein PKY81_14935, partial [bacterium]|nr:hypothetical protein [bacterium]
MKKILSLIFILILLNTVLFAAAIPKKLNFQGRVTDANNIPYNGVYSMTFRIYDTASGGNLLWSETQNNINIIKGLYSVLLGSVSEINLLFDKEYFLTVELNSGGEITTRVPIVPVAYSFRAFYSDTAANALTLNGYSSDSFILTGNFENQITNLESQAQSTENRVQSLESDSSFKSNQLSVISQQLSV